MPNLLEGKTALVLGVANRWSLAFSIAKAYRREGARVVLTYQSERQQQTVEELGQELGAEQIIAARPFERRTGWLSPLGPVLLR